jgi:hypothetical protein
MSKLNYPLNNVQIELMKLFNTNLSDVELAELKDVLVKFYANKAIHKADAIWEAEGLSNNITERVLAKDWQTPEEDSAWKDL